MDNDEILSNFKTIVEQAILKLSQEFNDRFNELDKKFTDKFNELDTNFTQKFIDLDKKVDDLDKKFTGKFKELDNKLDSLDNKFTYKLDELDEKFTQKYNYLNSRMFKYFMEQKQQNRNLQDINNTNTSIQKSIHSIECDIEALNFVQQESDKRIKQMS